MTLKYMIKQIRLIKKEYRKKNSSIHGLAHIIRVGIMADRLNMNHYQFDYEIPWSLALLHDIGRENDAKDDNHGYKSVEKINNWKIDINDYMKEAIINHPTKQKPESDYEKLLFDADRYDLIRLNYKLNRNFFSENFHSKYIVLAQYLGRFQNKQLLLDFCSQIEVSLYGMKILKRLLKKYI